MSRLSAAQVVKLGEYLNPDFDPNTLTVNQLLGLFGYHNIQYPTPYTKPKLVALFKDEIAAKSNKLKRERVKRANSVASDDGITDGHTGKPLNDKPAAPPRRSSRRLSRTPADSTDDEAVAPEPEESKPKRRRPSAQPRVPAPSIPIPLPTPPTPIVEESEPEDSPARKVIRRGRVSNFAEDSGWEDNNIFQSGAEESSPARAPVKARAPRKSTTTTKAPRKSGKATSAPPEMASDSDHLFSPSRSPAKFPETSFKPQLSRAAARETTAYVRANSAAPASPARPPPVFAVPSMVLEEDEPSSYAPSQANAEAVFHHTASSSPAAGVNEEDDEERLVGDSVDDQDEDDSTVSPRLGREAAHARAVSKTIADGGKSLVRRVPASPDRPWYLTALYLFAACLTLSLGYEYKRHSTHIGFCDTGKTTNDIVEQRKAEMAAIEECNRMNRTLLYATEEEQTTVSVGSSRECPPPLIIPQLHPMSCTPCPAHASCSRFTVVCDNGYLLRPHVLLSFLPPPPSTSPSSDTHDPASSISEFVWSGISKASDGMPGLGPIAFPPRCVVDSKRTNRISRLGSAIDRYLAQERGLRLCSGEFDNVKIPESEGGEAKKWGFKVKDIKTKMQPPIHGVQASFDSLFAEAIDGLVKIGGVITGHDSGGNTYIARETGDLSWNCALTVKMRDTWHAWRSNVIYSVVGLLATYLIRQRRAARRVEQKRIGELAQIAVDTLRNQELLYYTDPARTAAPYLPVDQLRDLVLQDEPSVKARAALWSRVGAVVEANANVRANLEETAAGDEARVWRWLGTPGRIAG